jgi:hypothetical protein
VAKLIQDGAALGIGVREVDLTRTSDVGRFIDLPFALYRAQPLWTPPLRSEMRERMNPARNHFFRHSEAVFMVAERRGSVVGRIAVLNHALYNEKHQDDTAFFHWFECVDDQAVADALFEAAAAWALGRGLRRVLGPMGFVQPEPPGILVRGFEHEGTANVPWHFPYYERLVLNAGFLPHSDHMSGYVDRSMPFPEKLVAYADASLQRWGLEVRAFSTKGELWDLAGRFYDAYLESFSAVPDFYPMIPEEFEALAGRMIELADPSTMKFLLRHGEVVGFLLAFRDITPGLRKARGNMLPFGWWHLMRSLARSDQCNIIALGVLPGHQMGGVNLALYSELIKTLWPSHYTRAEIVHVLETNLNTFGDMGSLGARWHKCHRVFGRDLGDATA